MWELAACVDGWNACHGAQDETEPMSFDDYDRLVDKHSEWIRTVH